MEARTGGDVRAGEGAGTGGEGGPRAARAGAGVSTGEEQAPGAATETGDVVGASEGVGLPWE